MELLSDWIGPRTSQALADALEWKLRDAVVAADGDAKIVDDGNTIRIKSSKKEFVQIIKIEDFSEPVQLWLSDAITKLKVEVAAEATFLPESDLEYEPKRITDGTVGGIIQLIEYEIVAQRHGPKWTRLSMIVKKIKLIGSSGSGVFGAPCHVESLEPVIEMLDQLQTIYAQDPPVGQSSTPFNPPEGILSNDHAPSSQATSISSADDNLDKSQALLATQVPGLPSRKRLREGSPKFDENQPRVVKEVGTTRPATWTMGGTGGTVVAGHDSMDHHGAEMLPRSQDPSKYRENQDSTAKERHDALLSLLGPPNGPNQNQVQRPAIVTTYVDLHEGRKSPKPMSPQIDKGMAITDQPCQETVTPTAAEAHKPGMKSFRSSEKSNRISKLPKISTPPSRPLKAMQQSRKILTRISGREVKISKNQKDILDRSDSWCPPEPGKRAPTANVPISILQELNDRAERLARIAQGSSPASVTSGSLKRDQASQTGSEIGGDDIGSSNSDEPIPSADWPASSPEQSLLPPDSSAEYSEDPDRVGNQGTDPEPDLNSVTGVADDPSPSKRTSLSVSLSPTSDIPQRQSLQSEAAMKTRLTKSSDGILSSRRQLPASADRNSTDEWSFNKSSLDSNEETLKGLNDNKVYVQASATKPKMSLPELSKLSDDPMSSRSPCEEDSYANVGKAQANKMDLDAFEKPTRAPGLRPHLKANRISPLVPSSKLILNSPLTHDIIDEQSLKYLSPRSIRKAEAYHGSDYPRKVEKDSQDSDSDLETSIPHGLDRTIDIPSTFCDDQGPVLQVNRTPYVHSLLKPLSASSKEANNGMLQDTDVLKKQSYRLSKSGDLSAPATYILGQNAISKQDDSFEVDDPISTIEETKLRPSIPLPRSSSPRNLQATKRKASEPVVLSPNVTKRRRESRAGRTGSETDSRHKVADPRDLGRQHRNEMFALFSEKEHHEIAAPDTSCSAKGEAPDMDVISKDNSTVQIETGKLQLGNKSEDTLGGDPALLQAFPQSPDVVHETRLEDSYGKPSQPSKIDRRDKAEIVKQEENPEDRDGLRKLPNPILRLRKCLIRPLHEGDAKRLASEANNPEIAKWMRNAFRYPYRLEDATEWIASATSASPLHDFAICRPDDNTIIGGIGLKASHDVSYRTMQIGYWLGEEHWRQGIAKEAVSAFSEWTFEQFKHVLRLEAEVYEGNSASVRVLENAGFTFEAKKRNAIEKLGVVTSVLVYCKFPDSEGSQERKPTPNLVTAEQIIAGVNPTSEQDNATEDPKNGGSDLPKPNSQFDQDMRQAEHTDPLSLFDRFKIAYPAYSGNEGHFAAICRKIILLVRKNSMEHPSLWDDFAVRHRTEYTQYLIQCNDDAVDPLPYERFYREKVSETKYSCSSGLVLTRNNISSLLPPEALQQRVSNLDSSSDELSIPQSSEVDDGTSAGSPAATRREVGPNAIKFNGVSPDSGVAHNSRLSRAKAADRLDGKTFLIGSTLQRQESRPPSHETASRSSNNVTRSTFSLGAEKLFQDLTRPKGETEKEVIELTSGSEDEQSDIIPRRPAISKAKTKSGGRSLPWTGTNPQPNAKGSDTAGIAASTPTTPVPKHGPKLPASTSKAGLPEGSRPFAAFRSAKSGKEDVIEVPTPTSHKPSKDMASPEKSTEKSAWIDDEHTPYKTWMRRFESITPGKGNSFAQDLQQGNGASKRKVKVKEKLVDPLSWEL